MTQRALGLLVRREHSRKELTRKLIARGATRDEATEVVDTLAAAGWQDDRRFAEVLARERACSGHGPRRIRAELQAHGLEGRVQEALGSVEDDSALDWVANARRLVQRRYPTAYAGDDAARRRAADFLLRRGYSVGQLRAALDWDDTEG